MNEVFLLNESLKEELVQNCKASYAHTTWNPNGLNSIPFIAKILGEGIVDNISYYETTVRWPEHTEEENLENGLSVIDFYIKKINKIATMTDVVEEENMNGIFFTWAIFLDKKCENDFNWG